MFGWMLWKRCSARWAFGGVGGKENVERQMFLDSLSSNPEYVEALIVQGAG